MTVRTFFWGAVWTIIGLLVIGHIAGGWYFSGVIIEDAFEPRPNPLESVSGDYELEGLTVTPAEAEPLFAPLQEAGYPQLAITYRNDDQQPLDPSGFYQYGATEHEDVAGAVEFARANGAEQIVLNGFSTGAGHVMSFAFRQPTGRISGLLLDSPNINMSDTIDFRASQRQLIGPINVPFTLSAVAKFFTALRIDVNWQQIDYISQAENALRLPVLIHHGAEDDSVPLRQSIELQETKPELVTLVQVPGAGHVESYDADFDGYVGRVLAFIASVEQDT